MKNNERYFLTLPLRVWVFGAIIGVISVVMHEIVGMENNPIGSSPTINPNFNLVATHKHDWECNYIIRDSYTYDEETTHYIDSYVKNVDNSISFVADDGLVTEIPYPYYEVIKNNNL